MGKNVFKNIGTEAMPLSIKPKDKEERLRSLLSVMLNDSYFVILPAAVGRGRLALLRKSSW